MGGERGWRQELLNSPSSLLSLNEGGCSSSLASGYSFICNMKGDQDKYSDECQCS